MNVLEILKQDPKHFRLMYWKKKEYRPTGTSEFWIGAVGSDVMPMQTKITRTMIQGMQKQGQITEDISLCSKRIVAFKLTETLV